MWALVEDNEVSKVFPRPKAITIGDNQYPQNIFNVWSSEELEAIGIYEVVIDNTNYKNPEYYINTDQSFDFANDTVTASYGTATAQALDELKTNHKEVINSQAGSLLSATDWYTIREADGGTACPDNITTHRAAIRTKANDMCTAIDDASDVDALAALYEYSENDDGDMVRPLGEFPVLS